MQQKLVRQNISEAVATALRDRIVGGRLAGGERINEVRLAAELGVSRTPLREALTRLTGEGAVTSLPRLGFYVCPLSAEEVEQLYPIRAILDPAALRLGRIPPAGQLRKLRTLNGRMRREHDPRQVIALDDEWHLDLVAACPNTILLGLIEQFIWRTRRYELALMSDGGNVRNAADEHDLILDALEAGDLEGGCEGLRRNMQSGKAPVLAWLAKRQRTDACAGPC
ncbi:MAG TPA: GntR family transcriptional regulator [Caulobacteraceae bacterium]|jgi:DNA-binding GntR family transcriptional regulator